MPTAPGGGAAPGGRSATGVGPAAKAGAGGIGNKTAGVLGPITSTRAMRAATGIFAARTGPVGGPPNYTFSNGRIVRTS